MFSIGKEWGISKNPYIVERDEFVTYNESSKSNINEDNIENNKNFIEDRVEISSQAKDELNNINLESHGPSRGPINKRDS
ncbi:MAG: hypothetical protein QXY79_03065 [Candidatus Methanomethylicia archaeon]|nr:hypothetical protein [Spirochaetota bacterium]